MILIRYFLPDKIKPLFYLGHLDVVWFRVVFIRTTDQQSEKCVKLLPTVSIDCSTNGPHHSKDKQALKPTGYLRKTREH